MKRALLVLFLASACNEKTPSPATTQPTSSTPAASAAPSASASASPALTPEEKAKEEKAKEEKAKADAQLEKDRAKARAEQEAEVARWTPQLRKDAAALADKVFKKGHEALLAVTASKHRRPASFERDKDRHPVETFDFYKLAPTMTVLEFAPGEAWFTELLAPALAKQGKLYATSTDPNGPKNDRMTFYGERFKSFLERSPEVYGKVETVIINPAKPSLPMEGTLDMVIMMRAMHGVVNAGALDKWLGVMHKALKDGGILAVEQHRAKPDANPQQSSKNGYLPEKWVIEQVEAAGFKLAEKSEINANTKDTKDYPEGVWTLPPTLRLGDKDKATYMAIGESDRMTLRFTKAKKP